jgi:hypothetical protein
VISGRFGYRGACLPIASFLDWRPKGNNSDDNQRRKSNLVKLTLDADTAPEVGVGRPGEQLVIDNGALVLLSFAQTFSGQTI